MKPEQILHVATANYLRTVLSAPAFWSTFPAGGGGFLRGVNLKRAGLKAGVPDVMILHDGRNYWIELKATGGRLSSDQIAAHYAILMAGGHVAVCRSIEDVREWLAKWKIPTRERIAA